MSAARSRRPPTPASTPPRPGPSCVTWWSPGPGRRADRRVGNPMASAAVDVAVTDLSLRRQGITLAGALGRDDPQGPGLAWTAVVGVQPNVDEVLAEVDDAIRSGAASVKLKIGPGWDLEPVRAVRDAWPRLRVAVDANGSYGRDDTDHLVGLAGLLAERKGYIEQPLAAADLPGLSRLASRSPVPVALDESVTSATDAGVFGALRSRGLINVKPARLGGVSATLALSELVAGQPATWRPETFLGGLFETGVGRSAALAIGRCRGHTGGDRPGSERVVLRRRPDRAAGPRFRLVALGFVEAGPQPGPQAGAAGRVGGRPAADPAVSARAVDLGVAGEFSVARWSGSAGELHGLGWPEPLVPTVWDLRVTSPAAGARLHPAGGRCRPGQTGRARPGADHPAQRRGRGGGRARQRCVARRVRCLAPIVAGSTMWADRSGGWATPG